MFLGKICLMVLAVVALSFNVACDPNVNLSNALNCFSLNFYQALPKGDANLVVSPFSTDVILSLLLFGSGGSTRRTLREILNYKDQILTEAAVETAFKQVLTSIVSSPGHSISIANSMWPKQDLTLNAQFTKVVNGFVNSEALDYVSNAQSSTKTINNWVSDNTQTVIKRIFDTLDTSEILPLVNVINLQAKWQTPFPLAHTVNRTVTNADGDKKIVPIMQVKSLFKYKADNELKAHVLELDFTGGTFSFVAILPTANNDFSTLESSLTCSQIQTGFKTTTTSVTEVTMPRFHRDSNFTLVTPFKKLGLSDVLTADANFSGIAADLKFSTFQHKVRVSVDEQGANATAVFGAGLTPEVVKPTTFVAGVTPVVVNKFKADSPFMFLIRHNPTNVFLFFGRFVAF